MINIKQLPQINVQLWPNVIHMGYMTEVIRRMGLEWNPEPSAPGEEPVVTAVRIVSTDPKAKKAGGLCVALKGQPVSPADEVDSEKEYGLVAYELESEEKNENN